MIEGISGEGDSVVARYFDMACAKRLEEELYDINKDPWQMKNLAGSAEYASQKQKLRARLDEWMADTKDPRANGVDDRWDKCAYRNRK